MKTIQNKRTTIEADDNGKVVLITYSDLIKTVMRQAKPDGYNIDEMRKDFRVLDALNGKAQKEIKLEDADFAHLKSKVNTAKYIVHHKDIVDFVDDINAIK
jgi:KaiC/GvpD/RAD55 family RecA-like ATPase